MIIRDEWRASDPAEMAEMLKNIPLVSLLKEWQIQLPGELAQLVERVVRNDEVRGSIPLLSILKT